MGRYIHAAVTSRGRAIAACAGIAVLLPGPAAGQQTPAGPIAAGTPPPAAAAPAEPATDPGREHDVAARLAVTGGAGELVRMGEPPFPARVAHVRRDRRRGAVLILPDMGGAAGAPLYRLLQEELSAGDWMSVAVQLPMLPRGATREDYAAGLDAAAERMRAATAWLAGQGVSRIVALGHGYGADVALHATAGNALPEVISIVTGNWRLAPENIDQAQPVPLPERPVFDLYGGRDRALRLAGERRASSWNHSSWYTSWELAAADVNFAGCEAQFAGRVRGWLARVDKLVPPS